jgi:Cysteine-rich secretory protein family
MEGSFCSAGWRSARRQADSWDLQLSTNRKDMRLLPVPLALFAFGLATWATAIELARGDQFALDSDKLSAWILKETNAYRQKKGVPPLSLEPAIARVAQEYAQFLRVPTRADIQRMVAIRASALPIMASRIAVCGKTSSSTGLRPKSCLGKLSPPKLCRIGSSPLGTDETFSGPKPLTWALASLAGLTRRSTIIRLSRSSSSPAFRQSSQEACAVRA